MEEKKNTEKLSLSKVLCELTIYFIDGPYCVLFSLFQFIIGCIETFQRWK